MLFVKKSILKEISILTIAKVFLKKTISQSSNNVTLQSPKPSSAAVDLLNNPKQSNLKYLPVTAIDINRTEENSRIAKNKLCFFYHVILRTIESCLSGTYSNFDAHTTSTCCHGIAILTQEFILDVTSLDLKQLQKEGHEKLEILNKDITNNKDHLCSWWVPESLLNLARLYILGFAKKIDPERGILTSKIKLKSIYQIGTRFCDQLVDSLQKHFSNLTAFRYGHYLSKMPKDMRMHGVLTEIWGQYVQPKYLRIDRQGIYYASAMFSMQISLAYLMVSKVKVAIINDIIEETGQVKARLGSIFQGNGYDQMRLLTPQEIKNLHSNSEDPIIVFGGCAYLDNSDEEKIMYRMNPWLNQFPSLILACDVFYPQFPRVSDDLEFNSDPIIPYEDCLRDVISKHSEITGVAAFDPSLFCLSHVYTASAKQVLSVLHGNIARTLPISYIPSAKVPTCSV